MKKSFLAVALLSFVCAVILAGCKPKDETTAPTPPPATPPATNAPAQ